MRVAVVLISFVALFAAALAWNPPVIITNPPGYMNSEFYDSGNQCFRAGYRNCRPASATTSSVTIGCCEGLKCQLYFRSKVGRCVADRNGPKRPTPFINGKAPAPWPPIVNGKEPAPVSPLPFVNGKGPAPWPPMPFVNGKGPAYESAKPFVNGKGPAPWPPINGEGPAPAALPSDTK